MMNTMKTLAVAALCAATASFAQPPATFGRYLDVTVNTTATGGGADVDEAVTDFPLLLRLTPQNAADVLDEALPGGADVRFSGADGKSLGYEIEYWSDTLALIWVRASEIEGNASTMLRMHWGKAGVSSASDPASVFNTSNGYSAVFHLNEAAGDTAWDATGAYMGVPAGPADPANVLPGATGGHLGVAKAFGGNFSDSTNPFSPGGAFVVRTAAGDGSHSEFNYAQANPTFTMSAWVWIEENPGDCCADLRRGILTKADHGGSTNQADPDPRSWFMRPNFVQEGDVTRYQFQPGSETSSGPHSVSLNDSSTGIWTYVSFSATGAGLPNALRVYNESTTAFLENAPANDFPESSIPVVIGGFWSSDSSATDSVSHFLNGMVDEVRISSVGRTNAWMDLEFATQRPNATAISYGSAQDNDTSSVFLYPLQAATFVRNQAIDPISPYIAPGNTATSYSVTPGLPAGLTLNTMNGEISGTPTGTAAEQDYEFTAVVGGNNHTYTLSLTVIAGFPPSAPIGVEATAADGEATVTWTAPQSSGSSAITGYTVAASPGSETCEWTSGDLTCTVTGLTNGTDYTFTVTASNGVGPGPASDPSEEVTPATAPDAPTDLEVDTTGTSLAISWTAPASDGGTAITATNLIFEPTGPFCSATGTQTSCTVFNANAGTSYSVRAVATNGAGTGDTSAAITFQAPTTSLLPGAFVIQSAGTPHRFVLSSVAAASTEAFTMSISDIWGRTVWSKTTHPMKDGTREITWNGRNTSGQTVSPGMYVVRVRTISGGNAANFVQKSVTLR